MSPARPRHLGSERSTARTRRVGLDHRHRPASVQVLRDLDYGEVEALDPSERGAADISFVAADVEASLAGMGPVGWGGHTVEEGVDLTTLIDATKKTAILLYRLTR